MFLFICLFFSTVFQIFAIRDAHIFGEGAENFHFGPLLIQETFPGLDAVNHKGDAGCVTGVKIKCFLLRNSESRTSKHNVTEIEGSG